MYLLGQIFSFIRHQIFRFWSSWTCQTEYGGSILAKSANFDRNQICEFRGCDIDSKCKMKLKHHTFRISKFWDS